ncbi:MAG: DMT family transporter [Caulobacteraceae bacterium]|nr:DMT family transporter [Caulobacter sp.]
MTFWPYLLLLVAGVGWGLGFPFAELALPEVSPPQLIVLRFAVAAAPCLPLVLRSRETRRALADPWTWAAGAIYGLGFLLQFEGLARTNVTISALLVGLMPAEVALAAPLFGERVTPLGWAGVAAVTLGAALIAAKPGGHASASGLALLLAAMALFLGWLLALRRVREAGDRLAAPCAMVIACTVVLLAAAPFLHGWPPTHLTARAWAGVLGSGLISTSLATVAWQVGVARTPATAAGVFVNAEPLVGSALGVGLFHDPLTGALVAGGVLIVSGSVATVLGQRRQAPPRRGG